MVFPSKKVWREILEKAKAEVVAKFGEGGLKDGFGGISGAYRYAISKTEAEYRKKWEDKLVGRGLRPCRRCGGSGRYSWNQKDLDKCYGCGGSGINELKKKEKSKKGWRESQRPILTQKGIENKAPRHYDVSKKKEIENVLRQPLVLADESAQVKIVEKAIEAKNPIEQFQGIRLRYQGKYAIIREVMQNSERAGRDRKIPVDMVLTFKPDSFTIEDNAGGVTKHTINKVFKLGESGWQTLGEETNPFGEGFISFILMFNKAEVISNDVNAEFDWEWIEEQYKKNPKFDMSKAYKVAEYDNDETLKAKNKFIAIFSKPLPMYDQTKAIKIAKEIAKAMPVNSITINGEAANNKIDFKTAPGGYASINKPYGEKDGIVGYFAAGTENDALRLYFQGAPVGSVSGEVVDNYYWNLPALKGHVNVAHTFYGHPNEARDGWIQDDAIERTENNIKAIAKALAIEYVKYAPDSAIERLQHFISSYTTFDEIKYHIRFEVIEPEIVELVAKVERHLHKELTEENFKKHMTELLKSPSKLNEAVERAKDYSPQIDAAAYNEKQKQLEEEREKLQQQEQELKTKPETPKEAVAQPASPEQQIVDDKQQVIKEKEQELVQEKETTEKKRKSVEEKIDEFLLSRSGGGMTFGKWKKETFWCDRKEVEEYADAIKMAGYYKINIAISENKFQRQGFEEFENFHHISELESSMSIVPTISNPGARNAQERRIEFIIRVFLDAAGYNDVKVVIANIVGHRVITVRNTRKKIDEEVDLVAYAEHSTKSIYLQRNISFGIADGYQDYHGIKALYPYLAYNDFPSDSKSIGQGDVAVFLKIRKTLAHELAHLLHNTKDDTADHFKALVAIDSNFDKVIAEFKASSRLSDSLTGLNKRARERIGIQKGDTVVVTVTKGTEGQVEKQEVPALRKTTMNDIYQNVSNKELFTYRELIERYDNMEDLQKAINEGSYKFMGYKIGDRVQYNTVYGEERKGVIKAISKYKPMDIAIIQEDLGEGFGESQFYPCGNIIKVLDKIKPKYLKGEIFVREEDKMAKTYSQILEYHNAGDFPIESGRYKPTGLKIGDRVIFDIGQEPVREGIIKAVEGSLKILEDDNQFKKEQKYEVYRDVEEVKKKVEPTNQMSFDDVLKGG